MTTQLKPNTPQRHWQASLHLGIQYQTQRQASVLSQYHKQGPLAVQRALYPEGRHICHLYMLHPPGGMVTGDDLRIHVDVQSNAHALLTTPSAGKAYRTPANAQPQQQHQHLAVAAAATLEWFPQEIILFDGANTRLNTDIHLATQARFIGWDITCLGRPHGNAFFNHGLSVQKVRLWLDGVLHLNEVSRFDAQQQAFFQQRFGLHQHTVIATLWLKPHPDEIADWAALHDTVQMDALSHTQLGPVFVYRYLGHSAEQAKQYFIQIWHQYRQAVRQQNATTPRIWLT